MYVVLPIIFMLLGPTRSPRVALSAWLATAVFAWFFHSVSSDSVIDFAPCFISGVIAYTLSGYFPKRLPALLWIAFLLPMIVGFSLGQHSIPEGSNNLPFGWIFCLAIGIAIPMFQDSTSTALNHIAHRVARYSYGIYLFHDVGLWVGCTVLNTWWEPLRWAIAAAITAALSVGSYHLLEKPAIDFGARVAGRWSRPKDGGVRAPAAS
jgi:peptidoglycan/LPS O-acetylase OafA/YrhL